MATYEVASVLAPHADRMLASQELEPGHGWNYASLQVIADDPSIGVDALGSELIDGFEAQAAEQENGDSIQPSPPAPTQLPAPAPAPGTLRAPPAASGATARTQTHPV